MPEKIFNTVYLRKIIDMIVLDFTHTNSLLKHVMLHCRGRAMGTECLTSVLAQIPVLLPRKQNQIVWDLVNRGHMSI